MRFPPFCLPVFAALVAGLAGQLRAAESEGPAWPALREATFTAVWQTVNESYFDPKFGGVDWTAVREKYRPRLERVAGNPELRRLLQAMLNELHQTHFAILPRDAAVFHASERPRMGTIGAELVYCEGQVVIAKVSPGASASVAGLTPGDAVEAVDGRELTTARTYLAESGLTAAHQGLFLTQFVTSQLQSAVGAKVSLVVRNVAGAARPVTVTCGPHTGDWSEPVGNFPSEPIEYETRRLTGAVGYLHFNIFTPQLMRGLKIYLTNLRPEDGLILDLRGNPGGLAEMAPGISGWLAHSEFSLGTMHLRQGLLQFDVFPQAHAFSGPVAILIDSGSASTSELLAAGLRDVHRARLFGEPSAGAALPSSVKTLPNGDLMQYAIANLQTPRGALIEGQGVLPDEKILRSRADLAAGRDPVLTAAQAWLKTAR